MANRASLLNVVDCVEHEHPVQGFDGENDQAEMLLFGLENLKLTK